MLAMKLRRFMAFMHTSETGAMRKTDVPSLPTNTKTEELGILMPSISLGAKLF